jgi:hypothetical protein
MATLLKHVQRTLPKDLEIPDAIRKLFAWIEKNGKVFDAVGLNDPGGQLVSAARLAKARAKIGDPEVRVGTEIVFGPEGDPELYYDSWFGSDDPEIRRRLCVFAKTGAEGSRAALWIDDKGETRVVHMGSGSGSTMVCLLGKRPVDFLRLVAIGYDEICWPEHFSAPPRREKDPKDEYSVAGIPDVKFQDWVRSTFGVTIPKTAAQIVPAPAFMRDKSPVDPFARWVKKMTG